MSKASLLIQSQRLGVGRAHLLTSPSLGLGSLSVPLMEPETAFTKPAGSSKGGKQDGTTCQLLKGLGLGQNVSLLVHFHLPKYVHSLVIFS